METMENVNKLLLQNVLPLHVASSFMGKTIRNQVKKTEHGRDVQKILIINYMPWLAHNSVSYDNFHVSFSTVYRVKFILNCKASYILDYYKVSCYPN